MQVDECVFSQKTYKPRAWCGVGRNVQSQNMWLPQKCIAAVAAVSPKLGLVHFMLREGSIKQADFALFL